MSLSLYQASVPVFVRMFGNLSAILDKAAVYAEARKIDPAVLLNARLALMSRQATQAAADLRQIERVLPRYFDAQSRKTQLLQSMVSEAIAQSQLTQVPRPDDTLAALATIAAAEASSDTENP